MDRGIPHNGHWIFPEACLIICAKAPEPGKVKTRLLPAISEYEAASLQNRLLFETLELTHSRPLCPVQLWCSPDTEHPAFLRASTQYPISLHRQSGRNLGERMENAIASNLKRFKAALLIGCDCPSLTMEDLISSLSALHRGFDVALGPAEDGGYVLIGMTRPFPELFRNMQWGTSAVLSATRTKITRHGLKYFETKAQWDLDRPDDLQRYRLAKVEEKHE